jgi:hypothetical protein
MVVMVKLELGLVMTSERNLLKVRKLTLVLVVSFLKPEVNMSEAE